MNFLLIIGAFITLFQAMAKGYIGIEKGTLLLIFMIFLTAARVSVIVKLIATCLAIYFFAKEYGLMIPANLKAFTPSFFQLCLIMLGCYIMFRGPFVRR